MPKVRNQPKCRCGCNEPTGRYCIDGIFKSYLAFIPGHDPRKVIRDGQKQCTKCRLWKSTSEFYGTNRNPPGLMGECKSCNRKRAKETKFRLHGSPTAYHRWRRYHLTQEDVDRMIAEQGVVCPLCRKRPPKAVDHCHDTQRVRGILCMRCNSAIGTIGDTEEAAQRLAEYLHAPGHRRLIERDTGRATVLVALVADRLTDPTPPETAEPTFETPLVTPPIALPTSLNGFARKLPNPINHS